MMLLTARYDHSHYITMTYIAIEIHQHIQGAKSQTGGTPVLPSSVQKTPHLWLKKAGFELHATCTTKADSVNVFNANTEVNVSL